MKLTIKKNILCIMIALFFSNAYADVRPSVSNVNPHLQSINYDGNIYKFYSAIGIVTTVEFDKDEEVKDFAMGDDQAWKVAKNGNLLVIKPKQLNGSTNLTVFTNKRKYLFWVEMITKNDKRVPYLLTVIPPNKQPVGEGKKTAEMLAIEAEEAKKLARQKEIEEVKRNLKNAKNEGNINKDYWIVGAKELQPVAAEDNGTFTSLTFSASNPLPVAFVLEPDGTESLVDSHMEGDTMVLHRVVKKIMLRRGDLVAGITNKNLSTNSMSSPTGTVSDKVEREVLGVE